MHFRNKPVTRGFDAMEELELLSALLPLVRAHFKSIFSAFILQYLQLYSSYAAQCLLQMR